MAKLEGFTKEDARTQEEMEGILQKKLLELRGLLFGDDGGYKTVDCSFTIQKTFYINGDVLYSINRHGYATSDFKFQSSTYIRALDALIDYIDLNIFALSGGGKSNDQ